MSTKISRLPRLDEGRGYSVQETALRLKVSHVSVYGLIRDGKLGSRLIGKRRVVPGMEIMRFLRGEPPLMSEPIDPAVSARHQKSGSAGGLAKAANASRRSRPQAGA